MGDSDWEEPTLEYRRPDTPEPRPPVSWPLRIAYILLVLPLIELHLEGGAYPIPPNAAVRFYITVGVGAGSALFIVRRRTRSVIGWIALIAWGVIPLAVVIKTLLGS